MSGANATDSVAFVNPMGDPDGGSDEQASLSTGEQDAGGEESWSKVSSAVRKFNISKLFRSPDAYADKVESTSAAAVKWLECVGPGEAYSRHNITPHMGAFYELSHLRKRFVYFKNGLLDNQRNKQAYTRHQAKIEALEHSVLRMHEHLYDVLTCEEAREAAEKVMAEGAEPGKCKLAGGSGSLLDQEIEKQHPGFEQRFLEEICVMYKNLDTVLVERDSAQLKDHAHKWDPKRDLWIRGGSAGASVNDINDMLFFAQAPITRFTEKYHYRRNNLLDHVQIDVNEEELLANDGRDGKDVKFVPGGDVPRFVCEPGMQEEGDLISLQQRLTLLKKETGESHDELCGPGFQHLAEFLQWHLNGLDESITQMRLMGELVRLNLDSLDQLRYKLVTLILNLTVTYMVTFGKEVREEVLSNGTSVV